MKIKHCKLFTIILLQLSGLTFAQENQTNNSLQKTEFALQVNGGYNFIGSSPEAVVFGLKYHITNKSALRINIGVNFSENGSGREHHSGDTLNNFDNFNNFQHEDHSGNNNEQYFALLQYMFYPKPMKIINIFFGLGPRFGTGTSHSERYMNSTDDTNDGDEHGNNSWSIGLSGVFGAEWFATKSLSLFAEYGAAYSYQNKNNNDLAFNEKDNNNNFTESETSEFGFTDLSAKVGLSLYFDNPF